MPLPSPRRFRSRQSSFRFGAHWASILGTGFLVAVLWLPFCQLAMAAAQSVWRNPRMLDEVAPWQVLPRFLLGNTLSLGVLTAIAAAFFGVPAGVAIARGPWRLRRVFAILCALPLALPPILVAGAWLEATRTPPARSMASLAATQSSSWPPVALASVVLAACFFPLVAFATQSALGAVSQGAEDAARLFGGPFDAWRRVLIPLLWPAVAASCGLVMALAMWEIGAPDLLDARTYSVEIYRTLNAPDNLDAAGKSVKAVLAGVPMLLLGALALWPAARARRLYGERLASPDADAARDDHSRETPSATQRSLHMSTHDGRNQTQSPLSTTRDASRMSPRASEQNETQSQSDIAPMRRDNSRRSEGRVASVVTAFVLLLSPCLPLGVFARQLGSSRVLFDTWRDNDREIANTIGLSTVSALILVAVAFALVISWRDWTPRARHIALVLCVSPLLMAPVLAGVALLGFWSHTPTGFAPLDWMFDLVYSGLTQTGIDWLDAILGWITRFAMMFLGYATRFGPIAVLLLEDASRRVPAGQIEAARNLGASPFRALRTIWLPALKPALAGTYALLWALCASELATSVLVNQPGGQTLPVPIFNLLHIGSSEEVAALSLTLFALSGGAMALAALALRADKRRGFSRRA